MKDRRRWRTTGRIATYIAGCRCDECKAVAKQWKKAQREASA